MMSRFNIRNMFVPLEGQSILAWLIGLRWLILPVQLLALIPGLIIGFVDQSNLGFYVAVMLSLGVFNLWASVQFKKNPEPTQVMLFIHLFFDLLQLSILLAMTGGWNNPFSSVVFVFGVLGGILLKGRCKAVFVALFVLIVTSLQSFFSPEIVNLYPWTETVVDTIVEVFVSLLLVWIASSLVAQLLQQKKTLNQLKSNQLRLDRLRAIGALSAGVCHQIATPVNNIKLRLSRLERHMVDSEDFEEEFESLRASIDHTESAVKRLAKIHRQTGDELWFQEDLVGFVRQAINSWSDQLEHSSYQVKEQLSGELIMKFPGGALQQVLIDLLDNAGEAMPEGGHIDVSLECPEISPFIHLSVSDQGSGFSPDIIEALGEPFNSTKERGSGLGIYHTKIVANLMGGDIQVKNNPSGGATVTILLSKEFIDERVS